MLSDVLKMVNVLPPEIEIPNFAGRALMVALPQASDALDNWLQE